MPTDYLPLLLVPRGSADFVEDIIESKPDGRVTPSDSEESYRDHQVARNPKFDVKDGLRLRLRPLDIREEIL